MDAYSPPPRTASFTKSLYAFAIVAIAMPLISDKSPIAVGHLEHCMHVCGAQGWCTVRVHTYTPVSNSVHCRDMLLASQCTFGWLHSMYNTAAATLVGALPSHGLVVLSGRTPSCVVLGIEMLLVVLGIKTLAT